MVRKGNLAVFEGSSISETGRSRPPKLVYLHVTSTLICMNFLSRFTLIVRKGNLAVFEGSSISETGKVTPTKIGVLACYINPYLHEFFEPIHID